MSVFVKYCFIGSYLVHDSFVKIIGKKNKLNELLCPQIECSCVIMYEEILTKTTSKRFPIAKMLNRSNNAQKKESAVRIEDKRLENTTRMVKLNDEMKFSLTKNYCSDIFEARRKSYRKMLQLVCKNFTNKPTLKLEDPTKFNFFIFFVRFTHFFYILYNRRI